MLLFNKNLLTPIKFKKKLPKSFYINKQIYNWRLDIKKILNGTDNRKIIICGPCSIHDYNSAIDYAYKLKKIIKKYSKYLFIIMRVYLEKPRTTIGWKGLINDPNLNESYDINKGLILSRKLLLEINNIGIPVAGEILDMNIPSYLIDLFTWGSIGARTCESQIHRELISNINIPIGIKHTTDGNIINAINTIISSNKSHTFLCINKNGLININKSNGNLFCHLVLRGGNIPNYYKLNVLDSLNLLKKNKLLSAILIDCSHSNSNKNYKNQLKVCEYILKNNLLKDNLIKGIMLESFLLEGNQKLCNLKNLKYGISITDECIDWLSTEKIFYEFYKQLNINK